MFNGAGQVILGGFTVLAGGSVSLEQIRSGMPGEVIGGGVGLNGGPATTIRAQSRVYWEGIVRPRSQSIEGLFPYAKHAPVYYEPTDADRAHASWVGFGVQAIGAVALGAACAAIAPCLASAAVFGLGVATGMHAGWEYSSVNADIEDYMNIESGDLNASVGTYGFNFQSGSALTDESVISLEDVPWR
jgi:hypothetical protein